LLSPIAKDAARTLPARQHRDASNQLPVEEEPTFRPETLRRFGRHAYMFPCPVSAIPEGVESSSEKVLVSFAYGSDAEESEEGHGAG